MFDMESRPIIVKSVVESGDSGIESADSTADSAIIPLKISVCGYGPLIFDHRLSHPTRNCGFIQYSPKISC